MPNLSDNTQYSVLRDSLENPLYLHDMADEGRSRYYLAEWREERFKTQEQLEAESGVDQSTISSIERDPFRKRHKSTIERLCRALGINLGQLRQAPNSAVTASPKAADVSKHDLWKGFDALYLDGELTEKEVFDRILLLREEMRKRGIK